MLQIPPLLVQLPLQLIQQKQSIWQSTMKINYTQITNAAPQQWMHSNKKGSSIKIEAKSELFVVDTNGYNSNSLNSTLLPSISFFHRRTFLVKTKINSFLLLGWKIKCQVKRNRNILSSKEYNKYQYWCRKQWLLILLLFNKLNRYT